MNERIKELAEQAKKYALDAMIKITDKEQALKVYSEAYDTKFAKLIVLKCIEQGKQIQSQSVSNGSEEYNTGREMGIEVFLNQIKKHFGVE